MAFVLPQFFFSAGSQLWQGLPALAQGQLRLEQVEVREQEQHGSSRAGSVRRRFDWLFPALKVAGRTDTLVASRLAVGAGAGSSGALNWKVVGAVGASFCSLSSSQLSDDLCEPKAKKVVGTDRHSDSCEFEHDSCVGESCPFPQAHCASKGNPSGWGSA